MLETLAIIAYRQPVTRGDIEDIRGVTVTTDIMRVLLEREWIRQNGVRSVPGHPALYVTTPSFLGYFGLSSLEDLPTLEDPRAIVEIANDLQSNVTSNRDKLLDFDDAGLVESTDQISSGLSEESQDY